MKIKVSARWWYEDLKKRFGEQHTVHSVSNSSIAMLRDLARFGRFEAAMENELDSDGDEVWQIEFQNDYD